MTSGKSVHQILCDAHTEIEERRNKIQQYHDHLTAELREATHALRVLDTALKVQAKKKDVNHHEANERSANHRPQTDGLSPRAKFTERTRQAIHSQNGGGMTFEQLMEATDSKSQDFLRHILNKMIKVGDVEKQVHHGQALYLLTEMGTPEVA